jgi:hypothetical protein
VDQHDDGTAKEGEREASLTFRIGNSSGGLVRCGCGERGAHRRNASDSPAGCGNFSYAGTLSMDAGCGTTSNSHQVDKLSCGTTYYVRVWTSAGGGLYSQPITVRTFSCASAISAPTNLRVEFATKTAARLDWTPGKDNHWFCVDTARSTSDLLNLTGSWRNHACWTTSSQVTITGLKCGTVYYWQVYAWNRITNVHSNLTFFVTDSCDTSMEKADIEDVDVHKVGSEYRAEIEVKKPTSCHSFGAYEVEISGNLIEITVYNSVLDEPCMATPGDTYELTINLGSGFFSGVTYVVVVNNDESDTFTAS